MGIRRKNKEQKSRRNFEISEICFIKGEHLVQF